MWSPTHIQVTVQRARGLLIKGKNGTNNCFVTIAMGKEKYQTSIKEKATGAVDWHEECELAIPDRGNRAELILTCLHRNNLGIDQFLGQVTLPLNELDDDRPRSKWYKLESKPGQEKKDKDRGELEVRTMFTVVSGSLSDLSKKEKHKSSIGQLASSVGGSLLSIGTLEKRKGLKKFAKSLGSKMHISGKSKKGKDTDSDSYTGSFASIGTPNSVNSKKRFGQTIDDADPGVISEDEDEFVFDNLSHKSSGSSLNVRSASNHRVPSPEILSKEDLNLRSKTLPPAKPPRTPSEVKLDEWEVKLYGKHNMDLGSSDSLKRRSWENSRVPLPKKEDDIVEHVETFIENEQKSVTPTMNRSHILETVTAPVTPHLKEKELNLEDIVESESETVAEKVEKFENVEKIIDKPQPLPRSNTLPSIIEAVPPSSPKHSPSSNSSSPNASSNRKENDKNDKTEKKRFSKLKYFRKEISDFLVDKTEALEEVLRKQPQKQFGERIIIGHENNFAGMGSAQTEVSQDVLKKYEGKSREEVMLIADTLESEVSMQRQRVKELEDYLDNLLVRVMETHPKILQNPYPRTTSTKSG
uniref:Protein kinase c conserved region 2 n=1 Tax=Tabanus bromius TaxID=304241 RepID=A0A0K8TMX5_TABBR